MEKEVREGGKRKERRWVCLREGHAETGDRESTELLNECVPHSFVH